MAKKILVVDDEPDVSELIKKRLEAHGIEVDTAEDGEKALLKARESKPDLIITDIVMPVMDGFALYKELQKDALLANIPLLILSGRKKMEDSFRAMGVEHFVGKPFEADQLLEKVNQLLSQEVGIEAEELSTTPKAVGKKILIASSQKTVAENMRDQLEKQGHILECTLDGPHTIVRAVDFLPDVFILDIDLDEMPCPEVIKTLRYLPVIKTREILTFSSRDAAGSRDSAGMESLASTDEAVEACKGAGASASLGPFKEFTFLKSVQKYF
ncbi:MAG: response regulator [Candidatus Aceula meridiana]|nr:response regulator [Candidatus Aceula meridiana]